jgi:hypothetical protein
LLLLLLLWRLLWPKLHRLLPITVTTSSQLLLLQWQLLWWQ